MTAAAVLVLAAAVSGFVDVPGTSLYYERRGAGPDLVLIHGGQTDRRMWDGELALFAKRFRVLRYDVRGYGRSKPGKAPYASREDLFVLLRQLGVRKASFVGLSLGGRIAVDFALVHPEMVDRLVLAGAGLSGFDWSDEGAEWRDPLMKAARAGDGRRAAELWLESPYMKPAMEQPKLRDRLRRLALENAPAWLDGPEERALEPPAAGRLGEIRATTLVIVGSRDIPDIHRIADRLAARIPGARKIEIAGAGHMVNMERPQEFDRAVLEFLRAPRK